MNHILILLFFVYVGSMLVSGFCIYSYINKKRDGYINRGVLIGENLLLGSILMIGQMMILSLLKLYSAPFLWMVALLNYLFLFNKKVRDNIAELFTEVINDKAALVMFIGLLAVFIFRNMYFLVDVDSHSTYLFAQKLWLENKTSIFGTVAHDVRIFVPHFNAVPYALGLSIFPKDTFFAQLIVVKWSVIVFLLVYGYVGYRLNKFCGLAAVMLVMFNDHIFYSGANKFVIINSALIALLFSIAYNFYESRAANNSYRFLLAIVFAGQLMANKYQVLYVGLFMLFLGLVVQKNLGRKISEVFQDHKKVIVLACSVVFMLLWYLKNYLVTGVATFPIFADKFGVFNWTTEMTKVFNRAFVGPLSFMKVIKYISYLFIWPGIKAAKIVLITIIFLPLLVISSALKQKRDDGALFELCYWLLISLGVIIGLCLVSFVDPRHYRYGIAIFAVTSVLSINFIMTNVFDFKNKLFTTIIVFGLSFGGYKIIFSQGGDFVRPTYKDNLNVLTNRLHFKDVVGRYFPGNVIVDEYYDINKEITDKSAWDTGIAGMNTLSSFLLPYKPQIGLWHTTVIKWDAYSDEELILKDLSDNNIEWVFNVSEGKMNFISAKEYAKTAVKFDLHPKTLQYNYGFPAEISVVNY